jgi:hypothetical protein
MKNSLYRGDAMRLVKRLIELAFAIFIITLFAKNQGLEFSINYYGLKEPLKMAFWELVIFCVSLGILICALGDFVTQLKWIKEKRRIVKRDKDHQGELNRLNERVQILEKENEKLRVSPALPVPPLPEIAAPKKTLPDIAESREKKPETKS